MNRFHMLSFFNKCIHNKESILLISSKKSVECLNLNETRNLYSHFTFSKKYFSSQPNITKKFGKFRNNFKDFYLFGFGAGFSILLSESIRRFGIKDQLQAHEATDSTSSSAKENFKSWNFIADVVEKAAPAVVYIEISGKHPFSGKTIAVSNGSGFIVRADGLVITNAHVVGNSARVKVRLNDGTQKIGVVQAVDPVSDLATIKISGDNLPTVNLGKSSSIRPGEFVVAMGSPLQLSNTVTAGIVSSANRRSQDLGLHNKDINYIQTDANINFGNSGGPLINLNGEAIGINTMMVTTGISFAIPSDYAREFLNKAAQMEEKSKSSWFGNKGGISRQMGGKKYIGITMVTLTSDLLLTYKIQHRDLLDVDHGVLVYRVSLGSPADLGGVKPGDIITHINGKSINSSDDVYKAIDSADDKMAVKIVRGNKTIAVNLNPEAVE